MTTHQGGMMATPGSGIGNLMEVDAVSVVHVNGEAHLKVQPSYLLGLGWENKPVEVFALGHYKNWFRNILPKSQQSNADPLQPYFYHLHLICQPYGNSVFSSNQLLLEKIKIKAATELGWWSVKGPDGRFSFHLEEIIGDENFRVGVAKAMAASIPSDWRSSNFMPSDDKARMVDLHAHGPVDMEFQFAHAHHG
jgi:hypothetical protein